MEIEEIWNGDCLELMKDIPDGCIDEFILKINICMGMAFMLNICFYILITNKINKI